MQIVKKIVAAGILIFFLYSCDDKYNTIQTFKVTANNRSATADTVMKDGSGNFYFSRLRTPGTAGLIATYTLSTEHQNKGIYALVSGRIRTNYAHSNASIAFAAYDDKNEVLVWRAVFLRYYFTDIDQWCAFKDSIYFPANTKGKYYKSISALAFLGNSMKENFDIDTLKVEIKEKCN